MIKRETLQTGILRTIRSFSARGGRITNLQKNIFNELWPIIGLQLCAQMLDLEHVFKRVAPTVLEIGFGDGRALIANALQNPEKNYIGIEVYAEGVAKLLTNIKEHQISNIRVFCADAFEVLENCLPDRSLHQVQLFFPDPWPKARHHKRRIVQADFVRLIAQKLATGGTFHMATDWEAYAEHMLNVMQLEQGWEQLSPDNRPATKFEQRGLRLGHKTWDFMFRKCHNI